MARRNRRQLGAPLDERITSDREGHFEKRTGRFHDPETGRFEPGRSPPDFDERANRFRGRDGRFKGRSKDLYDEPREVQQGALWPQG